MIPCRNCAAEEFEVLRAADHEFHQREVVGIEGEDVVVAGNRMQAGLPAGGKRVGDRGAEDVRVIPLKVFELAVLPHCFFQHIRDYLIYRIEQEVRILGEFEGLSGVAERGVVRQQRAGSQDRNPPGVRQGAHRIQQVFQK